MKLVGRLRPSALFAAALVFAAGLLMPTAQAAPTLAEVQAKVRALEEEATAAAEGAGVVNAS